MVRIVEPPEKGFLERWWVIRVWRVRARVKTVAITVGVVRGSGFLGWGWGRGGLEGGVCCLSYLQRQRRH